MSDTKKSKILSSIEKRGLRNIAIMISQKNTVSLGFSNRESSYTDGNNIILSKSSESNLDIAQGLVSHEAGHIGYGSFTSVIKKIQTNLVREFRFPDQYAHNIVNAIEDCRIDGINHRVFPGFWKSLNEYGKILIEKNKAKMEADILMSIYLYLDESDGYEEFKNNFSLNKNELDTLEKARKLLKKESSPTVTPIVCKMIGDIIKVHMPEILPSTTFDNSSVNPETKEDRKLSDAVIRIIDKINELEPEDIDKIIDEIIKEEPEEPEEDKEEPEEDKEKPEEDKEKPEEDKEEPEEDKEEKKKGIDDLINEISNEDEEETEEPEESNKDDEEKPEEDDLENDLEDDLEDDLEETIEIKGDDEDEKLETDLEETIEIKGDDEDEKLETDLEEKSEEDGEIKSKTEKKTEYEEETEEEDKLEDNLIDLIEKIEITEEMIEEKIRKIKESKDKDFFIENIRKVEEVKINKSIMRADNIAYNIIVKNHKRTITMMKNYFSKLVKSSSSEKFNKTGRLNNTMIRTVTSDYTFKRCFTKKIVNKMPKLCLMIDISGSMAGNKMDLAKTSAIVLYESVKDICNLKITLFTGSRNALNIVVKDYNEDVTVDKLDLISLHKKQVQNVDGESVLCEANHLNDRNSMIIVISDGQPAADNGYDIEDAIPCFELAKKKVKKIFAFSVDAVGGYLNLLYGEGNYIYIDSHKDEELTDKLVKFSKLVLKEMLR